MYFRLISKHFPISAWGFTMRAATWDRLLNLWLHKLGLMGVAEKNIFEKYIKPGMTVLDVGANQGLYSLLFSRLVTENGKVHAFEPNHLLFESLQDNISLNNAKNIELYNIALGAAETSMRLHSSLINHGDNRLSSSPKFSACEQVTVKRFDEVLPKVCADFLKIDVQGWERHVFSGMEQLLKNSRNLVILFEFCKKDLDRAKSTPIELLLLLNNLGFSLYQFDSQAALSPEEFVKILPYNSYVNILAKK